MAVLPRALAQTTYVATLRGVSEVPPNNSAASGTATLVLSADERSARVSLSFTTLSDGQTEASAVHIHGPADPGVTGSALYDVPHHPFTDFAITFEDKGTLTVADQIQALKAGRLYLNVHSANYPNGEIRGQFYPAAAPSSLVRINCGGGQYVDAKGVTWQADSGFSEGASWTWGPTPVASTDDPALYLSVRYGPGGSGFRYTLPVANGSYTLRLHFVEGGSGGTGARVFDVSVNGAPALTNFDVYAAAGGWNTAVVRSFPVTVTENRVTIALRGVVWDAMISAIELVPDAPAVDPPSPADAIRFLEQATFGPTRADIAHVQQIGYEAYLNEQFAAPISGYDSLRVTTNSSGVFNPDDYVGIRERFFQNAVTGPDQLRQRVAFALSQILVVSGVDLSNGKVAALAGYQKVLAENALGNYRDLLRHITLNPAMGRYLNMANNVRAASPTGAQPNENYARELLQLFSIGVFWLNPDGTLQLDAENKPFPTYGNDEVKAFARALTGWTYANPDGSAPASGKNNTPRYGTFDSAAGTLTLYTPLVPDPRTVNSRGQYINNHDNGSKVLLGNVVVPAGQTAAQDLDAVLDNIFHHPNVGPFVCKQLIQKLVTSNPTPDYVGRVAAVFNNNGAGVRGDMKAVVRAILLDPEARGSVKTDPSYGHLREPALFLTSLLRALNATGSGAIPFGGLPGISLNLGQNILTSPTVFNFYQPDYRVNVNGEILLAPEVQTLTTETAIRRINFVNSLVYGTVAGTTIDISEWQTLAANPAQMVDALNQRLMHGAMSAAMRSRILDAVNGVRAGTNQMRDRARMALYLVLSSTQYQVQQ